MRWEVLKATLVMAAVLTLAGLAVCPHPPPPPEMPVDSVRAEAARRDTVFITDTLRLYGERQRARAVTDSVLDAPPLQHIARANDVPTDTAVVCFGLAAFDAWRAGLRDAIINERRVFGVEIAARNVRIADLTHDVGTLTMELEREQRRRRSDLPLVAAGALGGTVTALATDRSPILGLALGAGTGKLVARVVSPNRR